MGKRKGQTMVYMLTEWAKEGQTMVYMLTEWERTNNGLYVN